MFKKSAKAAVAACFLAVAGLSGCATWTGADEPQAFHPPYKSDTRTPSAYEEPAQPKEYRWDIRSQRFDMPGHPYCL